MWVKGSFYAFMGSSIYLFLKRFYIKELIGYFLVIVFWVMSILSSFLASSLVDLFLDWDCCLDTIASRGLNAYCPLEL